MSRAVTAHDLLKLASCTFDAIVKYSGNVENTENVDNISYTFTRQGIKNACKISLEDFIEEVASFAKQTHNQDFHQFAQYAPYLLLPSMFLYNQVFPLS